MPLKPDPKKVFFTYFPEQAVDYCFDIWQKNDFHFKISRKRQTKLGDYRYYFTDKSHTITINGDLNPFAFLVTYLHEVAHLYTRVKHGNKPEPHGQEWKSEFRLVAKPMLHSGVFPPKILKVFSDYLVNPKASSCADHDLIDALSAFDEPDGKEPLLQVSIGKAFEFNKRFFMKEKSVRTRSLCKDIQSGKKYLISNAARVITKFDVKTA
ncbi:MAG: transcription elongation protein SprT [Bacteroidetes bacterium]|nr:MAG: transcription elongation protein SprT [Bacteroidota bacterium]